MKNQNCRNCGGRIVFDPRSQKLKCMQCESLSDIEEENDKEIDETTQNMDLYNCPNCGAKLVADKNTTSTFCIYCKSAVVIKEKMKGHFHPDSIIPFAKTNEDAVAAFNSIRLNNRLVPDEFLDEKNVEELKGVYVPFWLIDLKVDGDLVATTKQTIVEDGSTGDDYTETIRKKKVTREGDISYKNLPVDASSHFDDDLMMNIEPFDAQKMIPYNSAYLLGFLSELYDVDDEAASKVASKRIKESARDVFANSLIGSHPVEVNVNSFDYKTEVLDKKYCLLPVYILNVKYEDKLYPFAMNGQTGKIVGEIPISKKKERRFTILTLLLYVCLAVFFSFFFVKFFQSDCHPLYVCIVAGMAAIFLAILRVVHEKESLKKAFSKQDYDKYLDDRIIENRASEVIGELVVTHNVNLDETLRKKFHH